MKENLLKHGILYVNDIISSTGMRLGYEEFKEKFNTNFILFWPYTSHIKKWVKGLNSNLYYGLSAEASVKMGEFKTIRRKIL